MKRRRRKRKRKRAKTPIETQGAAIDSVCATSIETGPLSQTKLWSVGLEWSEAERDRESVYVWDR
jgi:hypothetical protein